MKMSELKPCPFCGGEASTAIVQRPAGRNYRYLFAVGCKQCDMSIMRASEDKAEAIAAWNQRTEDKTRTQYRIVLPIEIANEKEFDHIRNWLADGDTSCAMLITLIDGAEKELKRYRAEGRNE